MKRFDAYEIRKVGEFEAGAGTCVEPLSEGSEESEALRVMWSLYGWRDGEGVDCIADRDTYADIREIYFAITGNDCGEEESDHFNMPREVQPCVI